MTNTAPEIREYRSRARAWLAENMPRCDGTPRGKGDTSPEAIAADRQLQRRLFDAGYAGISWPREYGGQGLPEEYERAFNQEAKAFELPLFGGLGTTTFGICVPTMLLHASARFLSEHVPRVLHGEELWAEFFSEPDAGSDLAGVRTRATRVGGRWLLSGSKTWSSGAYLADYGFCLARTNWDVPKHRGLTWFAVKLDKPGLEIRRIRQITGESDFCQEFFDDVELTDDDVVGPVDGGWNVTQTMLVFERKWGRDDDVDEAGGDGDHVAKAYDPVREIAPALRELLERRKLDGRTDVRQLVARSQINDVVEAELRSRVLDIGRRGNPDAASYSAYVKLAMGTFGPIRALIALEIGGLTGLAWDEQDRFGAASTRAYLSARTQSIAGGTNQIMCNVIGERLLELPREPSFDSDRPFGEVIRQATEWGKVGPRT